MARLKPSKRAGTAIAAVMALAVSIGGVWFVNAPDGTQTPAAVQLASEALIQPWEGRSLRAYHDRIAKPPVWTICDGDTQNVKPGMVETPAGCDERLRRRLSTEFYPAIKKCIADFEKKPVSWQAMMISLGWNIGTSAICRSTAARLGRAGDYLASCQAATAWNKAGGRMIIGLVNRREMGDASRLGEGELCVTGLDMEFSPPRVSDPAPAQPEAPAAPAAPDNGQWLGLLIGGGFSIAVIGGLALVLWRRRKTQA